MSHPPELGAGRRRLDPQAPARSGGAVAPRRSWRSSIPPSRSPRSRPAAARRSPRSRAGSSSTCSSRTRPAPGPASAWRPSGSRPTPRTSPPSGSSLSKGESFIDTAKNIEAMGADVMVVRHPTPGHPAPAGPAPRLLDHQRRRRRPRAPDPGPARPDDDPPRQGADRGPDRRPGRRHRPLAGRPLEHLGPDQAGRPGHPLRPADPRPQGMERLGCEVAYHLDEILPRCDVVNVLRIQFERQQRGCSPRSPSIRSST